MKDFPEYKTVDVDDLVPYARNSRTHSKEQVAQIAASIKEFGFLNPVIVDGDNGIVAGHGRVLAAQKIGMTTLPVIEASHLTEDQKRAYVIADNKLALNAGWDEEMLRVELTALESAGFDISLAGFTVDEHQELFDIQPQSENPYTRKVDAPLYEPKDEKPLLEMVYDRHKADKLIAKILESNIDEEDQQFLIAAASRHIVFDFEKVANYYAHSKPEVQELMEDSALVIIDFEKAITEGYVRLSAKMAEVYTQEKGPQNA
jgi:hypothetical protein